MHALLHLQINVPLVAPVRLLRRGQSRAIVVDERLGGVGGVAAASIRLAASKVGRSNGDSAVDARVRVGDVDIVSVRRRPHAGERE